MSKADLGQKQICPSDQTKFYDLGRRPAVCPKCGFSFDPEEIARGRRVRARTPDYEDDTAEKPAENLVADEAEEEEEAEVTPEIDVAATEPPPADETDVDERPGVGGADDSGVTFVEEDELEEDGEGVPFLEDEEEDEFPEDEIEGQIDGLGDEDDDRKV